ncbi:hypothetical protein PHJA_001204000 [Phtheirospermum japonicum]|uniref:GBF-interacting protein 1 N-terminal domain-containing protein n=1 Tax=Phtheirospermum japonicum TaxID=374723 RepID=A0A830BWB4_9LAMI|nr:hypothetical protein PHJA_001204000 [Phtheirospermum japonicum]
MVTGSKVEGGQQVLSAGVRKTIQSIKEIVGNHSDADIYVALKETNMDPNETAQKLLNQDPFHEVKRKRDRKKEPQNAVYKSFVPPEPRRNTELARIPVKTSTYPDHNARRGGYGLNTAPANIPVKNSTYPDHIPRRGGYGRHTASGASREFRVVRDNRVSQNASADSKPAQSSISTSEVVISSGSTKSNSTETSGHQEPSVGHHSSSNNPSDAQPKQTKVTTSGGNERKEILGEKPLPISSATSRVQAKANGPQPNSTSSSSNSVVGVYSSNSDPVHVPSPHSRPAANIGAIRREVGVVGPRRHSSENSAKPSLSQSTAPLPNTTQSGRDGQPRESTRPVNAISKSDQSSQNTIPEPTHDWYLVGGELTEAFFVVALQPNKEWKPKATVKPNASGTGVIGAAAKTVSPPENPDVSKKDAAQTQDSTSQLNISGNQNVIIAAHIRVSETDRCRLTFGSLGTELDASTNSVSVTAEGAEALSTDPSGSVSVSAPESSGDELAGGSKQLEMIDDSVRSSGSNSPALGAVSNHQLTETKESSGPQNLDNYVDVGLVRETSPSYTPESLQQQQDTSELASFSSYDPQMGYDMSYFRPIVDETVLSTHTTNANPASTIAMVQQQQQQQMAQMYPQLHVSHFANLMPYRQFISPVYVPPMPVPGYSNSPAYPHPPNGNSYVLMPGNSSHHLTASGIKYGIQQYKPMPTGGATGFGNFTSPAGYTINTPGVVASAGGHDEASRLKYKDSLYVTNPQAETSEIWMNPRGPSRSTVGLVLQHARSDTHPAYLTSHSGHASFTAAQSSHHAVPSRSGSGGQVGAYQQPQLGHLNWAGNF